MSGVVGALSGYRGIRADLLVALKKSQPLTAHELGAQFGLTANALRRHLKALEDDGLVQYRREVRGVGAPVFAFSLTVSGEALFPRSYLSVLASALEALRVSRGSDAVADVLASDWSALAADARPLLVDLPLAERAALLAELLTARGYMAEAVSASTTDHQGGTTLRIHNCAIGEIAEQFPEACKAEARFVEEMLAVPLVRGAHRLTGCTMCEYAMRSDDATHNGLATTPQWTEEQA